jgi:hypothetical protein
MLQTLEILSGMAGTSAGIAMLTWVKLRAFLPNNAAFAQAVAPKAG